MAVLFLVLAGISAVVVLTGAQCASSEHPSCASWVRNGFCTSGTYSQAHLQQYCPRSCSNSGCSGSIATGTQTTTAAFVENANCRKWSTDPATIFCVTGTDSLKKFHCKITCAYELAPTDACVIYYQKGSTVDSLRSNKTTSLNSLAADATLLYAFVNDGATINFYTTANLYINKYTGKGFYKLATNEQKSKFFCH